MASPAQIANDMEARAKFMDGRSRELLLACRAAARVIRAYLDGPHPDGRVVHGVLTRLFCVEAQLKAPGNDDIYRAIVRARETIIELRRGASDAA